MALDIFWTAYNRPMLMHGRLRRGGKDAPDHIDTFYDRYASEDKHIEAGDNSHLYDNKLADVQDEEAEPRTHFWSSLRAPWSGNTARLQSPDAPTPRSPQVMQKPEDRKGRDNVLDYADFATDKADTESKIRRPQASSAFGNHPFVDYLPASQTFETQV